MSAIAKILSSRIEKRSGVSNPSQWFIDWVTGGVETSTGVTVNEMSALKYTPFWAAVRIISGTLAALPFLVYKRNETGKTRVAKHPVYNLLHNRPNEYMDAITFIETRQAHVLTYGNGYAEIQRDGGGKPIALWPLLPNKTFRRITKEGIFYYEVHPTVGEIAYLPDYNVLHIKGLGFDGYTGYNVVDYHKEAIGYGIGVKKYAGQFFGRSATSGGTFEHPHTLSDKAKKHLQESLEKDYGGLSNAHRIMILEEGMKFNKNEVDPEQAQSLETQKYTVDDCARIFLMPPHKLASLQYATFSNIEEQNIDFATSTMLYWFRKWEQECDYKLFMPSERETMFCEILIDALLRGNIMNRYQAYNTGRNAGFLCVNDIREKENMNTIGEKGDIFLEPFNMKPAGTETPNKTIEPAKTNTNDNDDTNKNAFRNLLAGQWSRIIGRQKSNEITTEKLRSHAMTLLYDASKAYADTIGLSDINIRGILESVIIENINISTKLEDKADKYAELTMQRIGDNHA